MHDHALTRYSLSHLSDSVLVRELGALVAHDRVNTAALLAHLAEADDRRLYVAAGHSSMFAYCVDELHFSEDAAFKRIRAARAARRFPSLFKGVAEGRLHLAAVYLLSSHVNADNVERLIDAATHRRKAEIEAWLAEHFPAIETSDPPARVRALPGVVARPGVGREASDSLFAKGEGNGQVAPGPPGVAPGSVPGVAPRPVHGGDPGQVHGGDPVQVPGSVTGPDHVVAPGPPTDVLSGNGVMSGLAAREGGENEVAPGPPRSASEAPDASKGSEGGPSGPSPRFLLQVTISKATHDKLRLAQGLISHAIPAGDIAQVLDRALDALIAKLERQKIGARGAHRKSSTPVRAASGSEAPRPRKRFIPVHLRRAVWERDQGQCTFISARGYRCTARRFLEFDHVKPIARGGKATLEGLRLRCRVHNQFEAERAFGSEFMKRKRRDARLRKASGDSPVQPLGDGPTPGGSPRSNSPP